MEGGPSKARECRKNEVKLKKQPDKLKIKINANKVVIDFFIVISPRLIIWLSRFKKVI